MAENLLQFLERIVHKRGFLFDSCIIDDNVESAEGLHRTIDQGLHLVGFRYVGRDRNTFPSGIGNLFCGIARLIGIAHVIDHHRRPLLRETNRDRLSYASGRSGYDRDFLFQFH